MESVSLAANMAAKQQTQLELSEYNKSQEKTSEENLTNNPIETEQDLRQLKFDFHFQQRD